MLTRIYYLNRPDIYYLELLFSTDKKRQRFIFIGFGLLIINNITDVFSSASISSLGVFFWPINGHGGCLLIGNCYKEKLNNDKTMI